MCSRLCGVKNYLSGSQSNFIELDLFFFISIGWITSFLKRFFLFLSVFGLGRFDFSGSFSIRFISFLSTASMFSNFKSLLREGFSTSSIVGSKSSFDNSGSSPSSNAHLPLYGLYVQRGIEP